MHEFALAEEILAIVSRRAAGAQVQRVVLEVGKLAAVSTDALRFAFDVCSEGSVAAGAKLDIVEIPGRGRCRRCGGDVLLDRLFGQCGCGCMDLEFLSGEELSIKAMEVT